MPLATKSDQAVARRPAPFPQTARDVELAALPREIILNIQGVLTRKSTYLTFKIDFSVQNMTFSLYLYARKRFISELFKWVSFHAS